MQNLMESIFQETQFIYSGSTDYNQLWPLHQARIEEIQKSAYQDFSQRDLSHLNLSGQYFHNCSPGCGFEPMLNSVSHLIK